MLPLIRHISPGASYLEPCAGQYDLCDHLGAHGLTCIAATDIAPRDGRVHRMDALTITPEDAAQTGADYIITNPPWSREILHPMIELFSDALPTWLLFDADWIQTVQSAPFQWRLRRVVCVGRVKWIKGSKHTGKDNASWYLFDAKGTGPAEIFGRVA
ncbi:hypothetical protein Ga0080574_TMP2780 [Salipiger abyssi]|uniref:Uncharacterized protein n=1 Tax=Salipiger abyssi TaxID=1250539 RepID=A0A1P8UUN8_9RHOB|nr:hypothetical protein Ga0080574_TMP2780 [Salipiger abyssi]